MVVAVNETVPLPRENVYGSIGGVRWIESWLRPHDRVVDLGCGTGYMVTFPLLVHGRDVIGVDLDARSIEYGRDLFVTVGLDPERLRVGSLSDVDAPCDALIVS